MATFSNATQITGTGTPVKQKPAPITATPQPIQQAAGVPQIQTPVIPGVGNMQDMQKLKLLNTNASGIPSAQTTAFDGSTMSNSGPQAISSAALQQNQLRNNTMQEYMTSHPGALFTDTGKAGIQQAFNSVPKLDANGQLPIGDPSKDGANSISAFYNDLMKHQEQDWAQQQQMLQAQMGGFQREADSLNARMGGSIAGGYAGLAGAGLGKGMDAYNKASLAYNQLRQQTGRDEFGALNNERQRQEEHTWDDERHTQDMEMQVAQLAIENDIPIAEAQKLFDASSGKPQSFADKQAADRLKAAQTMGIEQDNAKINASIAKLEKERDKYDPNSIIGKGVHKRMNQAIKKLKAKLRTG